MSAADAHARDDRKPLDVGPFSRTAVGKLPDGWRTLTFPKIERHTDYRVVEEDGTTVVRAEARNSASGLVRPISIDPTEAPVIEWRWKIANVLEKANPRTKSGDDYPARIYIT